MSLMGKPLILLLLQLLLLHISHQATAFDVEVTPPKVSPPLTPQQCAAAFARLRFHEFDFSRYNQFYERNSTITLAEAGVYTGPESIEEYVRFAHTSSPYIDAFAPNTFISHVVSVDRAAGRCAIMWTSKYSYRMSVEYSIPVNVTVSHLVKATFSYTRNVIERIDIRYVPAWLHIFFGRLLNTVPVKQYICKTIRDSCPQTHALNGNSSMHGCVRKLNALPTFTNGRADAFDFSCRALHAVFAGVNPRDHCAHISLFDQKDLAGNVKCQKSQNINAADLFTQTELELHFSDMRKLGVDPELGYKVKCEDAAEWKTPLGDGSGGCNWVAKRPGVRCGVDQADLACAKSCNPQCQIA